MAVRGFDPYEEARLRAILEETTGQKRLPGAQTPAFPFYNPQQPEDYGVENFEDEDLGASKNAAPVMLTDIPTSSLNASRPRTVAAGFQLYVGAKAHEQPLGKMTVMFRDGTLYNYYDVTPGEWQNFQASISKGRPWLNRQNAKQAVDGLFIGKPRGPADLSNVSETVRQSIYKIARTSQVRYQYRGRVPKVAKPKAQLAPGSATSKRLTGKNPATGGKNPNQ